MFTNNVTAILINKNLTTQGKSPQTTIIDAQGIGNIFCITVGNKLTPINVTLINGAYSKSGIIYNKGSLTLNNCVFEDNRAFIKDGVIYTENTTDLGIINCNFNNNSVPTNIGGTISNVNVSNTFISNCVFINNNVIFTQQLLKINIGTQLLLILPSRIILQIILW